MDDKRAIAALAALAHDTRLKIFRLLVEAGPSGIAAGEIAQALDVPPPTLSFHLTHMKHAGLVDARRDSRSLIYVADFEQMNGLIGYLTDNCCRGNPDACAPGAACDPLPLSRSPASKGARHEAVSRPRRR
jgi:ArsR family transcriptional regulator, arsenate/arsenite/antimonite-responsive transcriptional repressor